MIRFGEKRKEAIIIIVERKKNQNINRSIFSSSEAGKFKRNNFLKDSTTACTELDMDEDSIEEQQLIEEAGISRELEMIEQAAAEEQSCLKERVEGVSPSKTNSIQTPLSSSSTTTPSIMAAVAALGLPVTLARDIVSENGDTNTVKNSVVRAITVVGADSESQNSSTNQNALTIIPSSNRRFVLRSAVNENGKNGEDATIRDTSYSEVNFEENSTTKIVINEQVVSDKIHQGEDEGEFANVNYARSGCVLERRKGEEEEMVDAMAGAEEHNEALVSPSDTCELSSRKHQIHDISYRSQDEQGSSNQLASVDIEEQVRLTEVHPRSAATKDSSLLQFAENQAATAEETPYTATSIIINNNNNSKRKQSDSLPNDNIDTKDLKNDEPTKGIDSNAIPADSQSESYNSEPEENNSDIEHESLGISTEDNTITVTVGGPPVSPSNMIDATDFRMGSGGTSECSPYATLASVNGRMSPPPPGHGGHPTHHVHGYHVNTSYATLTPLQPLPPISTLSSMQDKFQAYSPNGGSSHPNQGPGSFGSGGMQNNSLSNISLGSPYNTYDKLPMGISPPPYGGHNTGHAIMSGNNGGHESHSPSSSALSPHEGPNGNDNYPSQNIGLNAKQEPMSPNSAGYYESNSIVHSNNTNNKQHQSSPGGNHHELSPHSSSHGIDHSPNSVTNSTGGHNGHHGGMHAPTSIYGSEPLTSTNNPSLNGMASISPQTISPVPHTSPGQLLPIHHPHELSPTSPTGINHGPGGGASILAAAAAVAASNASKPPSLHPNPHHVLAHQLGVVQAGQPSNMSHVQHNMISLKSNNANSGNSGHNGSGGETEEINTKDLAQRISAELKRYSIPQAIFAQRVLCRSQGTLSDLLRNPKPWSKLKSGRETFRRMQKWLSEPEFQRMSSLRLAGKHLYESFLKNNYCTFNTS